MFWIIVIAAATILLYFVLDHYLRSLDVGNYKDKYIFITGCDTGIGRQLVIHLDKLGFQVFASCLTEKGQDGLRETCSSNVKTCSLDITKPESIREAYEFVRANLPQGKGLWALVNNAGVFGNMLTPEMLTREDYIETIEVNLLGPIEVTRTLLPLIRKEKGRVVSTTSIVGRFPVTVPPYCVAKNGLEAYLDVLRKELYYQNVKVSMIQPGAFATNLMKSLEDRMRNSFENASDEVKAAYGIKHLEKRLTQLDLTVFNNDLGLVVDAYTHALTSRFPHIRYVVGMDAKFFFLPMSYLPQWMSDVIYVVIEELCISGRFQFWQQLAKMTKVKGKWNEKQQ